MRSSKLRNDAPVSVPKPLAAAVQCPRHGIGHVGVVVMIATGPRSANPTNSTLTRARASRATG
jgi:hypothetical protein